jgi:hypothetical protein
MNLGSADNVRRTIASKSRACRPRSDLIIKPTRLRPLDVLQFAATARSGGAFLMLLIPHVASVGAAAMV